MAPLAIVPDTISELTQAGIEHTILKTAPSITTNGTNGTNGINGHNGYTNGHSNGPHVALAELDASQLVFTRTTTPRAVPEPNSPEVWSTSVSTDHMVTCKWTAKDGWAAPHLEPYGPLSLMPTASVLHYATECFEGMKFYRGYDGRLRLFRPDRNCRRMLTSATRIALPAFNPAELQKLIAKLVSVDGAKWLPKSRPGTFIYLRPTMIATAAALGVQRPKEALLFIIAVYFPSFDDPAGIAGLLSLADNGQVNASLKKPGMKLLASQDDMVRAWPGGFGYAKVGANYGPSLIAQQEARERGYNQILWLFGKDCQVTEAGASNFFLVWRTPEGKLQLVTAPLDDKIILDGVTRRSILDLTKERLSNTWEDIEALEICERKYTMYEVEIAIEQGRVVEAFAAGTAFFVAPISEIHFRGKDLDIPMSEGETGKYARLIKGWLKNIMYGKEQHEWGFVVKEEMEEDA
ncbi:MAG: hypothetical protein MMC33_005367 [Icmadophila ericetorum]|nr:hypothetical protein [Icmadophila ericetorum]